MSPVEALATAIKFFDRQEVCLIARSLDRPLLRLLIAWFSRVKGQIAAAHSWLLIFSSLEVTLIPWSTPPNSFDRLIQFWSRSQTLLHGTYKWLPLVLPCIEGNFLLSSRESAKRYQVGGWGLYMGMATLHQRERWPISTSNHVRTPATCHHHNYIWMFTYIWGLIHNVSKPAFLAGFLS